MSVWQIDGRKQFPVDIQTFVGENLSEVTGQNQMGLR